MTPSLRRLLLVAAATLAVTPVIAHADCLITGPTTFCSTTTLCGPAGAFEYDWQGSGIIEYDGACVVVNQTGSITLNAIDLSTGQVSTCTVNVTRTDAPVATISGPGDGCSGTPLTLCGPDGWSYAWTGPGGFTATTACIDALTPGDYTLVIHDASGGCVSAPTTHTVSFHDCTPPPPTNCPRPASWWSGACSGAVPGVGLDLTSSVAACVDAHAASFGWGTDTNAFCNALRMHPGDLRNRALRQFAAVIANTCGGSMTWPDAVGHVALDPATPLAMTGMTGTVGDWIAATDAELAQLANGHGSATRDVYRNIVETAWTINHGRGIGAVCAADSGMTLSGNERWAGRDESLAEELSDDDGAAASRVDVVGNPAHGVARVSLALGASAPDVVVGVYDLNGRLVREIAHGAFPAGAIELTWDGRDAAGTPMPNGVYFVHARVGGARTQVRLTLLR